MRAERAFPRIKRRVNCDVEVSGNSHVGVVLDLSPGGFFVQTTAPAQIGSKVVIKLHDQDGPISVEATVANRRKIPQRLATVARGGLGCALRTPPEDYFQFLGSLTRSRG